MGRSRIFWIFCMKSLVICDSDFPVRGCSVCARKRDKLYVGEYMALTISLSAMFGLCTFGSPYSFGRRYVSFNVDLILLGMLLFFTRILVFCAIVLVESLSSFLYALSERMIMRTDQFSYPSPTSHPTILFFPSTIPQVA